MIRPREIRAARRAAREAMNPPPVRRGVRAGPHNRSEAATPAQLEAAEALRHERDLLCIGAPSDAELWAVMARARA